MEALFRSSPRRSRRRISQEAERIETKAFFVPMPQQPVFSNMGLFRDYAHRVAGNLWFRGLYLRSGSSGLTKDGMRHICRVLSQIRSEYTGNKV